MHKQQQINKAHIKIYITRDGIDEETNRILLPFIAPRHVILFRLTTQKISYPVVVVVIGGDIRRSHRCHQHTKKISAITAKYSINVYNNRRENRPTSKSTNQTTHNNSTTT